MLEISRRWVFNLLWHHFPSLIWWNRSLRLSIIIFRRCILLPSSTLFSWMNFIWILLNILNCHRLRSGPIQIFVLIILWSFSLLDLFIFQLLSEHLHLRIICLLYIFKVLRKICWWFVPVLSLWIVFVKWIGLFNLTKVCKWSYIIYILVWCMGIQSTII